MNLLILSCSQTKRPDPGLLPAIDRYDGPAYRVLRKWVDVHSTWQEFLRIRILSAEYGLISRFALIPDYDRMMTNARAADLRGQVADSLQRLCWIYPTFDRAFIYLGETYRLAMPDPLPFPATWATGGIGQRSGQLKRWLEGLDEGGVA